MKVARTRLARTLADQTLKSGLSKSFAREVAAYLLSERRTNELESLLRDVQTEWAAAGQVEVIAASAYPLTVPIKTDIKNRVKQLYPEARQIIVTERHDPDIIGGVRLNLPNQQLDLSIETKLNKLKQLTAGRE